MIVADAHLQADIIFQLLKWYFNPNFKKIFFKNAYLEMGENEPVFS